MNLDSMQEIVAAARREGKRFWEIILETDMENRGVSRSESMDKMALNWHTMKEASEVYTGERRSLSGMAGGQGKLMHDYAEKSPIGGEFMAQVVAEALAMGESNACMRRVVAAPTAGACGVLPAVLIPLYWRENLPGLYLRRRRRVPGGDRKRLRHGGGGPGVPAGRYAGAAVPCGGHGAEESDGPGLRPGGGPGGGAMH